MYLTQVNISRPGGNKATARSPSPQSARITSHYHRISGKQEFQQTRRCRGDNTAKEQQAEHHPGKSTRHNYPPCAKRIEALTLPALPERVRETSRTNKPCAYSIS